FNNVFVIDSRQISNGQAFLVIEACRMAEEGMPAREIVGELNLMKERFYTSFIVNDLDYLKNIGQLSPFVATIFNSFLIRPVMTIKNGRMKFVKSRLGSKENSWYRYLETESGKMKNADKRMLVISYAGIPQKDLLHIRETIEKKVQFESIYFVQSSAAITVNSGDNAFSLLYLKKS
ncbi:MAG: DegV family EDD domain-containing protein, partial [Lachnospiraceae bacterium]|nr:DegV family EDD domain-containing protein [Lachnospiraceae bacterium]